MKCPNHPDLRPKPLASATEKDGNAEQIATAGTLYRCPGPGCTWSAWRGRDGWALMQERDAA